MWGFVFDVSGLYEVLNGILFKTFENWWNLPPVTPVLRMGKEYFYLWIPYGSKCGTGQAAYLTQRCPSPFYLSPLRHSLQKHSLLRCHKWCYLSLFTLLFFKYRICPTPVVFLCEAHLSHVHSYDANLQAFFNYKRVCDDLSRDRCL